MIDLSKKYAHYSERMRQAMDARTITNEELANRIDSHPVTISKLRRGKIQLDDEWRARVAEGLSMAEDILFGEEQLPLPSPAEIFHPLKRRGRKPANDNQTLQVYGLAAGSLTGHLVMTNEAIETIPCPPGLRNVEGAYALRTRGESMSPRYMPGDILYINPNQSVVTGDHVVIQMRKFEGDGTETWIKRYEGVTKDELVVSQYNPAAQMSFRRRYVQSLHRVLPVNELYTS